MDKTYTANAIASDGTMWAIYFSVETREDAQAIIDKLGLVVDGVYDFIESLDDCLH